MLYMLEKERDEEWVRNCFVASLLVMTRVFTRFFTRWGFVVYNIFKVSGLRKFGLKSRRPRH